MKALIATTALLLPCLATAASWSTYQGDTGHTGHVPTTLSAAVVPRLRWQAQPFSPFTSVSGIAVGADRVYVTPLASSSSVTKSVVALDFGSGQEHWRVNYTDVFSVNPPAFDGSSTIYLATGNHSGDTFLRALDIANGNERWRAPMEAQWERYLAPTLIDGVVASNGGYYGGLYVFDAAGGQERYFSALPQCDQMTPVPWGSSWVTLTTALNVIDRASGSVRHLPIPGHDSGCIYNQTPIIIGNVAYLTDAGRLIAINLLDGSTVFSRQILASGQISSDGQRLFLIASGAVNVRDLAGNFLGAFEYAPYSLIPPLIVTGTHVIAASPASGETAILDLSGQQPPVLIDHDGGLALVDGVLIIGGDDGIHAYALDTLFADGFETP